MVILPAIYIVALMKNDNAKIYMTVWTVMELIAVNLNNTLNFIFLKIVHIVYLSAVSV